MSVWSDLLLAFFHDPPDKAVRIPDHMSRTRRYLEAALEWKPSEVEAHGGLADQHASAIERLPMPKGDDTSRQVGLKDDGYGPLCPVHPMSAGRHPRPLNDCAIDESWMIQHIKRLVDGLPGAEEPQRFLALWRLLPERLANEKDWFARLPADTRIPDHTIWHHMDITAALAVSATGNRRHFLSFSLGPVQTFIATARTLRDLWTGSMILSWLTFQAMLPIIKSLGPTAMVYPSLRGLPLFDLWLRREQHIMALELESSVEELKSPCLPNRFLAVVPGGIDDQAAKILADQSEQAARNAWCRVCSAVRERLAAQIDKHIDSGLRDNWDRWWDKQVENFFDIRTALLPWNSSDDHTLVRLLAASGEFDDVFRDAGCVRSLARAIPEHHHPGYQQDSAGQWQHRLELSARLMEASKSIRHVPPSIAVQEGESVPPKCSLLGSYEQMGPAKLEDSATFWRQAAKISIQGVRIRERERLSAVSLVKRFAAPVFLAEELALSDRKLLRWDDTATVGAAEWLDRAQKSGFPGLDPQAIRERPDGNWSGQWLHAASQKEGEDDQCPDDIWAMIRKARQSPELGKPPAYYAILMMDGDHLGSWLRGERSPAVEDVMHSKMVKYYRGLRNDRVEVALKARRPVGPALHAALSEALANFALHFVPKIVEDHFGTLVYAGGDDVLALLPTSTALACALELNEALRSDWRKDKHGRERLLMGSRATLSGGLVIVHHKEDLRFALGEARAAEKRAKEAGRNALELSVCRRSGEHASALCPWDFVPTVTQWVQNFRRKNVSDRWAYRLRAEQPTLEGLGADITQAEIRRQIKRAEDSTRFAFGWEDKDRAGDELVKAFDLYRSAKSPPDGDSPDGTSRFDNHGQAFEQFITLCQSASFLARGRDQ